MVKPAFMNISNIKYYRFHGASAGYKAIAHTLAYNYIS